MVLQELEEHKTQLLRSGMMRAHVFRGHGQFGLKEKTIPKAGSGEAAVKVRLRAICGTDIHVMREYPVHPERREL